MTVTAAAANRWEYTGDNSTTSFTYNSRIFVSSDLDVYLNGSLQATGYTVTGVGDAGGGNVVFDTAPATDVEVTIIRDVPDAQPSSLPLGGPLPSVTIEQELDRRTIVSQQRGTVNDRIIQYKETDQALPSGELPALANLKGKYLKFDDSTGEPIAAEIAGLGAFSTGDAHTWTDTQTFSATGVAARFEGADASPGNERPVVVFARLDNTANSEIGAHQRRALDSAGTEVTYSTRYTEIQANTAGAHEGEDWFEVADGAGGTVNWLQGTKDGPALNDKRLILDTDRDTYVHTPSDDTVQIVIGGSIRVEISSAGVIELNEGPQLHTGTGSPESSVAAPVGSLFLRTDGGANTTLYVKESGVGNTGWAAK